MAARVVAPARPGQAVKMRGDAILIAWLHPASIFDLLFVTEIT